jgi:hypothetical protein
MSVNLFVIAVAQPARQSDAAEGFDVADGLSHRGESRPGEAESKYRWVTSAHNDAEGTLMA